MKECISKFGRRSCPKDRHGAKIHGSCVPHKENGKVTTYCCKKHNIHECNGKEQYGHCESDRGCKTAEKQHGPLECHLGCCIPRHSENKCDNNMYQCTGVGPIKSCPGNAQGTCVDGYINKIKVKCCKLSNNNDHTCQRRGEQAGPRGDEFGHCKTIKECKYAEKSYGENNLVCDHGCCVKKNGMFHETEEKPNFIKRMSRKRND
ncbi:hypothetical protein Ddc_18352 [Ditylenchus destructor]|nr:hypothetical protein Ddc_18352 [Ditylenchus destructor]